MNVAPSDSSTRSSLLQGVCARDPAAWRRLVDWVGPLVLHLCRQAGLTPEDREDVFQDVFLAVAHGIDRFHRDDPETSFRAWLLGIVRHKIADCFRRCQGEPRGAGGSDARAELANQPAPPLPASSDADARQRLLRRAVEILRNRFDSRTWQAFWRTAVDGQPAPAVAGELHMSPAAVRKARSRVLAHIRQELGNLPE
jgi:RNA polymerase sigma-70 factor (ECF subfamily)